MAAESAIPLPFLEQFLNDALDELEALDKESIFQHPINPAVYPNYDLNHIKNPMDFSTMRRKIKEHRYCNGFEFQHDFLQVIDDALSYFQEFTDDYNAAHRTLNLGTVPLRKLHENIERIIKLQDREIEIVKRDSLVSNDCNLLPLESSNNLNCKENHSGSSNERVPNGNDEEGLTMLRQCCSKLDPPEYNHNDIFIQQPLQVPETAALDCSIRGIHYSSYMPINSEMSSSRSKIRFSKYKIGGYKTTKSVKNYFPSKEQRRQLPYVLRMGILNDMIKYQLSRPQTDYSLTRVQNLKCELLEISMLVEAHPESINDIEADFHSTITKKDCNGIRGRRKVKRPRKICIKQASDAEEGMSQRLREFFGTKHRSPDLGTKNHLSGKHIEQQASRKSKDKKTVRKRKKTQSFGHRKEEQSSGNYVEGQLVEKHLKRQISEKPVVQELSEKAVVQELSEKAVVQELSEKAVVQELSEKSSKKQLSEKGSKEQLFEKHIERQSSERHVEGQLPERRIEKQTAGNHMEIQTSEKRKENQSEKSKEEQSSEKCAKKRSPENCTKEQSSGKLTAEKAFLDDNDTVIGEICKEKVAKIIVEEVDHFTGTTMISILKTKTSSVEPVPVVEEKSSVTHKVTVDDEESSCGNVKNDFLKSLELTRCVRPKSQGLSSKSSPHHGIPNSSRFLKRNSTISYCGLDSSCGEDSSYDPMESDFDISTSDDEDFSPNLKKSKVKRKMKIVAFNNRTKKLRPRKINESRIKVSTDTQISHENTSTRRRKMNSNERDSSESSSAFKAKEIIGDKGDPVKDVKLRPCTVRLEKLDNHLPTKRLKVMLTRCPSDVTESASQEDISYLGKIERDLDEKATSFFPAIPNISDVLNDKNLAVTKTLINKEEHLFWTVLGLNENLKGKPVEERFAQKVKKMDVLIKTVRMFPELWDMQNDSYDGKLLCKAKWQKVAWKLNSNVEKVKRKWKRLIETYRINHRTYIKQLPYDMHSADVIRKVAWTQYNYMYQMMFLQPTIFKSEKINEFEMDIANTVLDKKCDEDTTLLSSEQNQQNKQQFSNFMISDCFVNLCKLEMDVSVTPEIPDKIYLSKLPKSFIGVDPASFDAFGKHVGHLIKQVPIEKSAKCMNVINQILSSFIINNVHLSEK